MANATVVGLAAVISASTVAAGVSIAQAYSAHKIGDMTAGSAKGTSLTYQFEAVKNSAGAYGTQWRGKLSAPGGVTAKVDARADGFAWSQAVKISSTQSSRSASFAKNVYSDVIHLRTSSIRVCHVDYFLVWDSCAERTYSRG